MTVVRTKGDLVKRALAGGAENLMYLLEKWEQIRTKTIERG